MRFLILGLLFFPYFLAAQFVQIDRNTISESIYTLLDDSNSFNYELGAAFRFQFDNSRYNSNYKQFLVNYIGDDIAEFKQMRNRRDISLLKVVNNNFSLSINPIFTGEVLPSIKVARNTRGGVINFTFKRKFSIHSEFTENQVQPYLFAKSYFDSFHAAPGLLFVKNSKNNSIDYMTSNAYINGNLINDSSLKLNVTFGHFAHKFGNGERSLFLDANGLNPVGLRFIWDFGDNVDYCNYFAQLNGYLPPNGNLLFPKKYLAIHRLGIKLLKNKNLRFGFFEGIVHSRLNGAGGFDLDYLNPFIFYRTIESNLGSADNSLLGMDFSYRHKNFSFYNQILLDEFKLSEINKKWWGNKWAYQIGFKHVKKLTDFYGHLLKLEFNSIRPYVYSHYNGLNSFSNYNQGLAHPAGANLQEIVFKGFFAFPRLSNLLLDINFGIRKQGVDTFNSKYSMGSVVFKTSDVRPYDYNVTMLQGKLQQIQYLHLNLRKLFNHRLSMGIILDSYKSKLNNFNSTQVRFSLNYNWDPSQVIF